MLIIRFCFVIAAAVMLAVSPNTALAQGMNPAESERPILHTTRGMTLHSSGLDWAEIRSNPPAANAGIRGEVRLFSNRVDTITEQGFTFYTGNGSAKHAFVYWDDSASGQTRPDGLDGLRLRPAIFGADRTDPSGQYQSTRVADVRNAHLQGITGEGKLIEHAGATSDIVNFVAPGAVAFNNRGKTRFSSTRAVVHSCAPNADGSHCNTATSTGGFAIPDQGSRDKNQFAAAVTALVGQRFDLLDNADAWSIVWATRDATQDVMVQDHRGISVPATNGLDLRRALSPVGSIR